MRVVLKAVEKERGEIEERVLFNIKQQVEPYLNNMEERGLSPSQEYDLRIIKSNLNDIISPLGLRLSSNSFKLTPKEIEIATLIKQGSTTREISALQNVSEKTINAHRSNIRRKLGVKSNGINLKTVLRSLR